jgi:hypothetical protein
MTLFARSDVMSVSIASENGGCREGAHRRPVINGAPVKTWQLSCPPCEEWLRKNSSDLWTINEADIPETPDEVLNRESFEKRGAKDRDNVLALALASIANVQLPESLRRSISGFGTELPPVKGMLVCAEGHDVEAGSRFCPECGSPVRQPATTAQCPQGHENAATAKFCAECGSGITPAAMDTPAIEPPAAPRPARTPAARKAPARKPLRDMRAEDLRQIARDRGLSDAGSRLELIDRIRQAKVPAAA